MKVASPQMVQAQPTEPRYVPVQNVQPVQMQPQYVPVQPAQPLQPVQSPPVELTQQLPYVHTAPIRWEAVVDDKPDYADIGDSASYACAGQKLRYLLFVWYMPGQALIDCATSCAASNEPPPVLRDIPPPMKYEDPPQIQREAPPPVQREAPPPIPQQVDDGRVKELEELLDNGTVHCTIHALLPL